MEISNDPLQPEVPTRTVDGAPADPTDSSAADRALVGRMLGRYMVLHLLGEGGMGRVYKGFDASLDRHVAIKVLRRKPRARTTERLVREAKALAQLSHPNVIQVYEVGSTQGQTFIAMELVEGQTLRQWSARRPRPPWRECVGLYVQAGEGLAAAHARGLVHRDFKSSNAIVDREGRVRVLDFGLVHTAADGGTAADRGSLDSLTRSSGHDPALSTTAVARLTEIGVVVGTPGYMPPEQMQGGEVDARGDQFSFCVALYEALHGRRPFTGRSLEALEADVYAKFPLAAPEDGVVPARLHEALARGLAPTPEQRWPTMNALLERLREVAAPRRQPIVLSLAVVGGLGLVGAGLAVQAEWAHRSEQAAQAERAQRCTGAVAQLEGIWDEARAREVRASILGTEQSYAEDTWTGVRARLDDYAGAWAAAHTQACEATVVTQEQSEEALELRMGCLRERRADLHATVKVLARADAEVVARAGRMVAGLPPLDACDDVERLRELRQRLPPPGDPQVTLDVEVLRQQLADLEAEQEAGKYARALEQIGPLMAKVDALAYGPLQAEAHRLHGWLLAQSGGYDEAELELERAHALATSLGHDVVTIHAANDLVLVVGSRQQRYAEGMVWARAVLPLAERVGGDHEVALVRHSLGTVLGDQRRDEEAEREHRQALEIWEQTLGPEHPHVAAAQVSLGSALYRQGRYEEAEQHYLRALRIDQSVLGHDHPEMAKTLNNLGVVSDTRGEHEEAERYHRRALRIREQTLGLHHPLTATSLTNLGNVLHGQGEYRRAEEYHRRALEIRERALDPDHPSVMASVLNLGNAFYGQGDVEAAEAEYRRALSIARPDQDRHIVFVATVNLGSILESRGRHAEAEHQYRRALALGEQLLGDEHPDVANAAAGLGSVLYEQGQHEEAARQYDRALRIREQALGPDDPSLAGPLVGLAMIDLERRDYAAARSRAERAVSLQASNGVAPEVLAFSRFVLARALWPRRGERTRAQALAEQARDAYAKAGGAGRDGLAEVERWLARSSGR